MLGGMIVQREGLLHLVREAKPRQKTVVVGGPYATSVPQEVLAAGADFLVRGEGEITIPVWLAAWQAGERDGVIEPESRPEMTLSPAPRFDLLHLGDYIIVGIQTSRGCPFNCEFCDIINLYGRKPRYKSPDQVLAEVETLYNLGWRREIFICDDNFIGNQTHARAILKKLIPWMESHGEPFSFWTQVSANLGHHAAMVDLLTAANFGNVFIGVESPDEAVLVGNRKYQNLKNPLGQSLTNISTNGLGVVPSFIMGFDQETKGAGERICAFVEEHNLPAVMLNLLQALPNTALWDRLKEENRLTETGVSADMVEASFNFLPTRPAAEIVAEYIRTVDHLYEPTKYLARTYRYFLAMRPTRAAAVKAKTPGPGTKGRRFAGLSPAGRCGGAGEAALAPGNRGRLPGAILAAVVGDLPAKPQPHSQVSGAVRHGGKSVSDPGRPAGPGRPGAAGSLKAAGPRSQDCIYLWFIYDKNVLIEQKKFTGTAGGGGPEVP